MYVRMHDTNCSDPLYGLDYPAERRRRSSHFERIKVHQLRQLSTKIAWSAAR